VTNRLSHEHGVYDPCSVLLLFTSCNISYVYGFKRLNAEAVQSRSRRARAEIKKRFQSEMHEGLHVC
jgi:hypothetical protein